ncbi:unnamed protein product [Owenia fusiformis]|uniref:Endonuclease n=1 Tax=Owenia fusiformis TaxID=6347 RepID=A0A8J1Y2I6_OWEFU|nr:unnamed protein product [Owenia fusiformis]
MRMMKKAAWPLISAISMGAGTFIGAQYEKMYGLPNKQLGIDTIHGEKSKGSYILPLIEARSAPVDSNSLIAQNSDISDLNKPTVPSNRVSQIMRYGFPGLDNIRAFDDYVLSYDRRNRTAHWVFEHLNRDNTKHNDNVSRDKCEFFEDDSVHEYFRAKNSDYKKSGYDRGHLAAAANHRHSDSAMQQTFVLSNMAPQVGKGFNRDAWAMLEKYVRSLTKHFVNVYVCTGPLYLPRYENDGKLYVKYEVIGKNNVAVPTHFYKIVACEDKNGQIELLSFVMPNQPLPDNLQLNAYLVPLDTIERASGFLFFDKLPRNLVKRINGKKT